MLFSAQLGLFIRTAISDICGVELGGDATSATVTAGWEARSADMQELYKLYVAVWLCHAPWPTEEHTQIIRSYAVPPAWIFCETSNEVDDSACESLPTGQEMMACSRVSPTVLSPLLSLCSLTARLCEKVYDRAVLRQRSVARWGTVLMWCF